MKEEILYYVFFWEHVRDQAEHLCIKKKQVCYKVISRPRSTLKISFAPVNELQQPETP